MIIDTPMAVDADPSDDDNNDKDDEDDDKQDSDYDSDVQIVKKKRTADKAPTVAEPVKKHKAAPKKVKTLESLLKICGNEGEIDDTVINSYASMSAAEMYALDKDLGIFLIFSITAYYLIRLF